MPNTRKFILLFTVAILLLVVVFLGFLFIGGFGTGNVTDRCFMSESVFEEKDKISAKRLTPQEFKGLSDFFHAKSKPFWGDCKYEDPVHIDDIPGVVRTQNAIEKVSKHFNIDLKSSAVTYWSTDPIPNEDSTQYCNLLYVKFGSENYVLYQAAEGSYKKESLHD